ncbi:hypothetical protein SAMN05421545_0363 [Pontibacter lucknowensis]|uniref:Uncharacterized protein n=1 Tax=Pontibacter lucknowensis TaxID=1077936 RepID=A0A1N6TJ87_9BACT|nr:hypothetical protein SAMN05421545_0363 [Pontibacter lucknowensis]
MENYIENKDYEFLTLNEFEQIQEGDEFDCLLKLKIFEDKAQSKLDRTVYFKVNHKDKKKIDECTTWIRSFHFSFGKSFLYDYIVKQSQ